MNAQAACRYNHSMSLVRSHPWIDARSLALAKAVAMKVRSDPHLLDVARENLKRWKTTLSPWPDALAQWEKIVDQDVESMLAALVEDSPRGRRFRQSSPFAGVLSPKERAIIFDQYESTAA